MNMIKCKNKEEDDNGNWCGCGQLSEIKMLDMQKSKCNFVNIDMLQILNYRNLNCKLWEKHKKLNRLISAVIFS